jgi:branched-chain amino acid transport system ATP-binding protein
VSEATQQILDVVGLQAWYGRAQVLFDVSFSLAAGEVVALLGRNGAGKSTTIEAIMGLVSRTMRRAMFAGVDIADLPSHRIARLGLGFVPEERRIFTDLSVEENLEVGRQPARGGRSPWTPERLFHVFPNLAEMRSRRASQMSGGEQQMLTIARTLMGNPLAVLLDEPSEGLSPLIVQQMSDAIRRMRDEGIAVLLSEQNLPFASRAAARALIIDTGRIVFDGAMERVLSDAALREAHLGV